MKERLLCDALNLSAIRFHVKFLTPETAIAINSDAPMIIKLKIIEYIRTEIIRLYHNLQVSQGA